MRFHRPDAEVFIPDAASVHDSDAASLHASHASHALGRTTHLAIGAHPDDVEIFATEGILACYRQQERSFSAVVMTDGRSSARSGPFASISDERMAELRREEQREAARRGRYGAVVLLDYLSHQVKDPSNQQPVEDLHTILRATRPDVVYTHNLADRHATHVAVALRTLQALRLLASEYSPQRVIGCEVWGDLDWLPHTHKVIMDVSQHQELQSELLGAFTSQISGGKRYDLAALGRRRAHATFSDSHRTDQTQGLIYGWDLMPLLRDPALSLTDYVKSATSHFEAQVLRAIEAIA